ASTPGHRFLDVVTGHRLCQPARTNGPGGHRMLARVLLAAMSVLWCAPCPADAQTYPTHPIRLIAPFPAGGPVDVMARLIADKLTQNVGTTIVDNRPGAGGTIGSRLAAGAEPDGYTLLLGSSTSLTAAPSL